MNTGEEVDYDSKKTLLQLEDVEESNLWKMVSATVNKSLLIHMTKEKVRNTFPSIKYSFILERHSALQSAAIAGPTIIMILLNIIVLSAIVILNEARI